MNPMEDTKLWVYVVSVVVAVILIIIAVLVKKRNYGDHSNMKGYLAQGGIVAFLLFLAVICFMTYGTYRIDGMLSGGEQTVFRVIWAAQLIFLILFFFAYRMPKVGLGMICACFLLNIALIMYATTLTQQNMVPSWCYFPYILLTFAMVVGSSASTTHEAKMTMEML